MADSKITDLVEQTIVNDNDVLVVVDVANNETKKIKQSTIKDNYRTGVALLTDNTFTGNQNTTSLFVAGESLSEGDLCYLKSDGKMWKADNTSYITTTGKLGIATTNIVIDTQDVFLIDGVYNTTGLTIGNYFVGTSGGYTSTIPNTSTEQIRIIGVAISTTQLEFKPSLDVFEVA